MIFRDEKKYFRITCDRCIHYTKCSCAGNAIEYCTFPNEKDYLESCYNKFYCKCCDNFNDLILKDKEKIEE